MKEIKGSVMINVPAEKVWSTLVDFPAYKDWNPFITQMSGELKEDGIFDVTISLPDREDSKFQSTLVKMETNKELLLKGKIGFLMSEERSMLIEAIEESKCVFSQHIAYKGLMSMFAGKTVKASQTALNRMNEELKKRCEK
ncbi:MAG: SRPBCC domain-containing protein [Euryarchaeota archaeon]|nr:SRPBCC domain-containing protein [Euryarchaeota archaeon]